MLSYIYCYFCLLIGTRILGRANAFIYILLLLFTYGYAYTWYALGTANANAFIYILLLLFTDWYEYTWYGKCFHIYTATFVY